jgi:UDP-glucose 4-epimerase
MRILITGGSGYIGNYLARLWQGQHEVVVLDLVESEGPFDCVQGDLCSPDEVRGACHGVDAVIHAGAIPYDSGEPRQIMEVNVMGTFNVLESAVEHGVKKVVFISSMCATGIGPFSREAVVPQYFQVDEKEPCRPEDTYGLSKLMGEELCAGYSRKHGLSTVCLRLGMVFDPDRPDAVNRLRRIMENPDYGSLYQWGCLDVRDMAQAFDLALRARIMHGVYNLCGPEVAASEPTLELIARYFATVPLREPQVYFENPYRGLIDISKARKELGFEPRYPVRQSYTHLQA